jgi:uncharacterized protein YqgC (DUF456 family)
MEIAGHIGMWMGFAVVWLLCLAGIALSCFSFSGTWLVVVATVVCGLLRGSAFPGIWTVIVFVVIAAAVEGAEALAGGWGVKRRGGSTMAGLGAVLGGILGFIAGGLIPVPFVGSLIGMFVGSFALAFAIEYMRLKKAESAAHVAWGAVVARVAIIFLKVGVTLGMAGFLLVGVLRG